MNNNDDKDRWETFCKLYDKLSSKEEMRELFEEEIKCFSLYLSHVNQDYVYNATFLPQFNDDFWNFLCAFNKKYKIVEKLFDAAEKYYNVTLKIDRYWMMTVDEKGKIKKSILYTAAIVRTGTRIHGLCSRCRLAGIWYRHCFLQ